MQLSLFDNSKTIVSGKLPWIDIFPDWMPEINGIAQMHTVILPEFGYCYGDTFRIISINSDDVICRVEHQMDVNWWKNGKEYRCKLHDLWPNMY